MSLFTNEYCFTCIPRIMPCRALVAQRRSSMDAARLALFQARRAISASVESVQTSKVVAAPSAAQGGRPPLLPRSNSFGLSTASSSSANASGAAVSADAAKTPARRISSMFERASIRKSEKLRVAAATTAARSSEPGASSNFYSVSAPADRPMDAETGAETIEVTSTPLRDSKISFRTIAPKYSGFSTSPAGAPASASASSSVTKAPEQRTPLPSPHALFDGSPVGEPSNPPSRASMATLGSGSVKASSSSRPTSMPSVLRRSGSNTSGSNSSPASSPPLKSSAAEGASISPAGANAEQQQKLRRVSVSGGVRPPVPDSISYSSRTRGTPSPPSGIGIVQLLKDKSSVDKKDRSPKVTKTTCMQKRKYFYKLLLLSSCCINCVMLQKYLHNSRCLARRTTLPLLLLVQALR